MQCKNNTLIQERESGQSIKNRPEYTIQGFLIFQSSTSLNMNLKAPTSAAVEHYLKLPDRRTYSN